ncbi:Geranylgeranyl transferase type-1 subunit beta-like [Oopsacas minuta]|uniref:Geranylgeranyl transferase type-1 subunit beta n=1 Tax=Oopsacas minuta TaxID=111878 RepID=A0AAV7JWR3_9METZ|nr:Geranylgeranyl transferase type-1 subunit beta-like [Oopsacas minuta]
MTDESDNNSSSPPNELPSEFSFPRHAKYFEMMSGCLPSMLEEYDSIRMSILFFSLSGMDLLNTLDRCQGKDKIIDWIYSTMLTDSKALKTGFRGFNIGSEFSPTGCLEYCLFDTGHLAMTYTAIASLLILGDDLSRIDRECIAKTIGNLQTAEGSFLSCLEGGECDMRYIYCACCVCYILNDWRFVDKKRITDFIRQSVSFDFGIGQGPCLEGHGGSTFCGLASLALMGELDQCIGGKVKERIKKWCVFRQVTGFHGRPNKRVDTCYSFWIGGALKLLDANNLTSQHDLIEYLFSTENSITGGFSKWPDHSTDPLHSYMAISGLSLLGYPGVKPVDVRLNISSSAVERLKVLHLHWLNIV